MVNSGLRGTAKCGVGARGAGGASPRRARATAEATRNSATGEALQAIVELDLDEIAAIDPPRGFGRD